MTEIHELSCVYAEVGILLTKKTRLTSEMLSASQASEPGLLLQLSYSLTHVDIHGPDNAVSDPYRARVSCILFLFSLAI